MTVTVSAEGYILLHEVVSATTVADLASLRIAVRVLEAIRAVGVGPRGNGDGGGYRLAGPSAELELDEEGAAFLVAALTLAVKRIPVEFGAELLELLTRLTPA